MLGYLVFPGNIEHIEFDALRIFRILAEKQQLCVGTALGHDVPVAVICDRVELVFQKLAKVVERLFHIVECECAVFAFCSVGGYRRQLIGPRIAEHFTEKIQAVLLRVVAFVESLGVFTLHRSFLEKIELAEVQ